MPTWGCMSAQDVEHLQSRKSSWKESFRNNDKMFFHRFAQEWYHQHPRPKRVGKENMNKGCTDFCCSWFLNMVLSFQFWDQSSWTLAKTRYN